MRPEFYIERVFTFHPNFPIWIPVFAGECIRCESLPPKGQNIPDFKLRLQTKSGKFMDVEMIKHWCYLCHTWMDAVKRKEEILERYGEEPEDLIKKHILISNMRRKNVAVNQI